MPPEGSVVFTEERLLRFLGDSYSHSAAHLFVLKQAGKEAKASFFLVLLYRLLPGGVVQIKSVSVTGATALGDHRERKEVALRGTGRDLLGNETETLQPEFLRQNKFLL